MKKLRAEVKKHSLSLSRVLFSHCLDIFYFFIPQIPGGVGGWGVGGVGGWWWVMGAGRRYITNQSISLISSARTGYCTRHTCTHGGKEPEHFSFLLESKFCTILLIAKFFPTYTAKSFTIYTAKSFLINTGTCFPRYNAKNTRKSFPSLYF